MTVCSGFENGSPDLDCPGISSKRRMSKMTMATPSFSSDSPSITVLNCLEIPASCEVRRKTETESYKRKKKLRRLGKTEPMKLEK